MQYVCLQNLPNDSSGLTLMLLACFNTCSYWIILFQLVLIWMILFQLKLTWFEFVSIYVVIEWL